MRRTYRKKKFKPDKAKFRANQKIRAPKVNVIDEDGNILGEMDTKKAIDIATERGYDLVEVNPKEKPPKAKFMDYGRFQYEKEKLKAKQKKMQKKSEIKGVRMSFRISDHDLEVRYKQTLKFLQKGNKVKLELILRGRENAYVQNAIDRLNNFISRIDEEIEQLVVEKEPKKEGNRITAIIMNKQD